MVWRIPLICIQIESQISVPSSTLQYNKFELSLAKSPGAQTTEYICTNFLSPSFLPATRSHFLNEHMFFCKHHFLNNHIEKIHQ